MQYVFRLLLRNLYTFQQSINLTDLLVPQRIMCKERLHWVCSRFDFLVVACIILALHKIETFSKNEGFARYMPPIPRFVISGCYIKLEAQIQVIK